MVGPDATLQGGLIAAGSLFVLNFLIKKLHADIKVCRAYYKVSQYY